MRSALCLAIAAALPHAVRAACECGYTTNTNQVFQYALTTDFTTLSNSAFDSSSDWTITSIVYGASTSRPIATNYTSNNVAIVDKALHLTCSAYNKTYSNSIQSAQIHTTRTDILHGSFRATSKIVGNATGVVGALFFYANDDAEIDMELLTRDDPNTIRLTNQPDATSTVIMPDGLTRVTYNNYRFDWNSTATTFYVNDVLSDTKSSDIPTVNGSIYLNSWGGSSFAGTTPPSSDVIVAVTGIQLYFNTSDTALSSSWATACATAKTKVCSVDSESVQKNTTSTSSGQSVTKGPKAKFGNKIGSFLMAAAASLHLGA